MNDLIVPPEPPPERDDRGRFAPGHRQLAVPFQPGNDAASKYDPDYARQAFRLCLLRRGLTNVDLAQFFEVNESTIQNWINAYPDFKAAVKAGKEGADIDVAEGLYFRGKGGYVTESQAFKVKKIDPETGKQVEEVEVVQVDRYIPADTHAAKTWLSNRHGAEWRERFEATTPVPAQLAEKPVVNVNIETVVIREREELGDLLQNARAVATGSRRDN